MTKVQPHFDRAIKPQILKKLSTATYSIRLAMYNLIEDDLFDAVIQKAQKGVHVEVLLDSELSEQTINFLTKKASKLLEASGSIFLFENKNGAFSKMHNKFCVIDQRLIITGSYNWTNNAAGYSNENIVIIEDVPTVSSYLKEFNQLKNHDDTVIYSQDTELAIFFTVSKNIVQRHKDIKVKWAVPNADKVCFNDNVVTNSGSSIIEVHETQALTLLVSKGAYSCKKVISVKAVDTPKIIKFDCSSSIIRLGQSAHLIWEVTGDIDKIIIEPLGEVTHKGVKQVTPTLDTSYKLTVYDVFGSETSKDLILRVPNFKIPDFETVKIPLPEIKFSANFKIEKPQLYIERIHKIKNEIALNDSFLSNDSKKKSALIRSKQKGFHKKLKKSIRKNKVKIKIFRTKDLIIRYTESTLNGWLTKIRNIK